MQKPEPEDFSLWIHRLKTGDEEAANVVWDACFERLKQLAKRNLGMATQKAADEEDIALSALHSFMIRARNGKFPNLDDRESLWKLLFTITVRKSIRHIRWISTDMRSGDIDEARLGGENNLMGLDDFAGMDISPDSLVEQLDQQDAFNKVLDDLDPTLRAVVISKLEGQSVREIASQLGCSTRTVERKLRLIRKTWEELAADESDQQLDM
ncbi:MAG: sigma-70 family RNA polymerase sigma factor [Planctomycetota bacterium]